MGWAVFLFLLVVLCILSPSIGAAGQGAQPASPAVDPETGFVHSQRLESGVPLGGIGTGTFDWMTDGTVSRATINNNWEQPTGDLPASFAALWTRIGDRTTARVLALRSAYSLPATAALDYDGRYPEAVLTYPNSDLPLTVSLQAFSPLIPFDIRSSSFPAAVFVFHLKNNAPVPIDVSAALSWENTLGVGGTAAQGAFHDRTGDTVAPLPATEGYFGLQFTGPPLLAGATPAERLRNNATGEMTLMAYPPRREAVATTAGWNALDSRPPWWDTFAGEGTVVGSAPAGLEGKAHPAGVVAVRLTLKPRDSVDIPFVIAWYTPHLYLATGLDLGHYYQALFPDSSHVARSLLQDWRTLLSLTEEWQMRLLFSNLPGWLARRLIDSATPLTTHTVHTRDDRFAFIGEVGGPPGSNGGPTGALATLSQRLSINALLLTLFPRLSAQELAQYVALQSAEGLLPGNLGTLGDFPIPLPVNADSKTSTVPGSANPPTFPPAAPPETVLSGDAVESVSSFVIAGTHYLLWTGDRVFLDRHYPHLRGALSALLRHLDSDGLPDLPPVPAAPSSGPIGRGMRPATAILWLTALRAGEKMAGMAGDRNFAQECADAFAHGVEGIRKRFWNGRFYADPQDGGRPGAPSEIGRERGGGGICATDQLLGQFWADLLDLGPLLPDAEKMRAVQSLQTLNDQAPGFPFGPPYRIDAGGSLPSNDPTAAGCSVAASTLAEGVLYALEGQPEPGVALLQRLDETQRNALRSPWRVPWWFRADTGRSELPGLAGLAAAAVWSALYAIEGVALDVEAGQLTLTPNLPGTWRRLSAPVFAPTFWGWEEFRPLAHGGIVSFRLDRLIPLDGLTLRTGLGSTPNLVLKSVRVPGPPRTPATQNLTPTAHVSLGQNPIGSHVARMPSGDLRITFDAPLNMAVGDRLEIDVH